MNTRHLGILPLLACLCGFGVQADQDDPRLGALFAELKAAPDATTAQLVEAQIWRAWTSSGRDDVDELTNAGIEAMSERQLDRALALFERVVVMAPTFAEGWNKRATVYYLRGELAESVDDIRRTLALEPRHFGALSGMGLIFMQRGDEAGALEAYRAVVELHPNSPGARAQVEALESRVNKKSI